MFVCKMGSDITHFICNINLDTIHRIFVCNISSDRIHLIFVYNKCSDIPHFRM